MNSRMDDMTRIVGVFCLLILLCACQDTIPNRSTITPGSTADDTPVCTDSQELVEETQPNGDKVQVCKDKAVARPQDAVFWKSDFCICKDNKAISYGNCASFCSTKAVTTETLYANFTVTEAISLGGLGNLYNWCSKNLPGDTQNPQCELQAKDETGAVVTLDATIPLNTNSLTSNVSGLSENKTYVLSLVEKVSGAKSNSVQVIKFSSEINIATLGPLKQAPISQYTCMVRDFSTDSNTGDIFYESAYRLHFYFVPRIPPKPIPAGNSNLICHDIFNPLYGLVDQELYPRFEQLAGVFNLWDTTDPRFYDNTGNGQVDVNDLILKKTRDFGGTIPTGTSFFNTFRWPGSPTLQNDSGNNTSAQPLGYYMAPWIDQTTYKSYCLTNTQYSSSNPLFRALGDVIQVDTEGLYFGEKAPETVTNSSGQSEAGLSDYVLIRESDLKAVWFYLKNGVPTKPTEDNVANLAVFFYYPINKDSPFVRTSTQRVFRLKSAQELNASSSSSGSSSTSSQTVSTNGTSSTGAVTTYPPHDRKIGCVPKF